MRAIPARSQVDTLIEITELFVRPFFHIPEVHAPTARDEKTALRRENEATDSVGILSEIEHMGRARLHIPKTHVPALPLREITACSHEATPGPDSNDPAKTIVLAARKVPRLLYVGGNDQRSAFFRIAACKLAGDDETVFRIENQAENLCRYGNETVLLGHVGGERP